MFVGGLSNMRGFLKRVKEELEFLLDDYANGKYSALKKHIKFYVHPEPASTKFSTAWVGGLFRICLTTDIFIFSKLDQFIRL